MGTAVQSAVLLFKADQYFSRLVPNDKKSITYQIWQVLMKSAQSSGNEGLLRKAFAHSGSLHTVSLQRRRFLCESFVHALHGIPTPEEQPTTQTSNSSGCTLPLRSIKIDNTYALLLTTKATTPAAPTQSSATTPPAAPPALEFFP